MLETGGQKIKMALYLMPPIKYNGGGALESQL